jgi:hypothetical protein
MCLPAMPWIRLLNFQENVHLTKVLGFNLQKLKIVGRAPKQSNAG